VTFPHLEPWRPRSNSMSEVPTEVQARLSFGKAGLSVATNNLHAEFALGTFSVAGGEPFGALVVGDKAIALDALYSRDGRGPRSVLSILETLETSLPELRRAAEEIRNERASRRLLNLMSPIEPLTPHPPVLPRQFFCTGANYRGHVAGLMRGDPSMRPPGSEREDPEEVARRGEAEANEQAEKSHPFCFIKLPTAMVGARDEIILPRDVQKPDWELELAVVIGKPARRVSARGAMAHVAGYAILNDLTAREMVRSARFGFDWLAGKSHRTFAPFGPYIVPEAFVPDPYNLKIQLSVNGKMMQDESTSEMLIDISRQIEWLSSIVTLMPGDVISTGSPSGNGSMYGIFLKPGDVIDATITGLGTQHNVCVAEE
jgi:2,4-diketo-3-deoxy-L-fuconate hydrolase